LSKSRNQLPLFVSFFVLLLLIDVTAVLNPDACWVWLGDTRLAPVSGSMDHRLLTAKSHTLNAVGQATLARRYLGLVGLPNAHVVLTEQEATRASWISFQAIVVLKAAPAQKTLCLLLCRAPTIAAVLSTVVTCVVLVLDLGVTVALTLLVGVVNAEAARSTVLAEPPVHLKAMLPPILLPRRTHSLAIIALHLEIRLRIVTCR